VGADATDSDAVQATGLTGGYTVSAGQETGNVDAGVFAVGTGMSVSKTSPLGDDVTIAVAPGTQSAVLPVMFTVTNTGDEPLTEFEWSDDTTVGPVVTGWACDSSSVPVVVDAGFVLPVGASVTCTGTLPAMGAGTEHEDTVTVTARGQLSHRLVTEFDDFHVVVDAPEMLIVKEAFWVDDIASSDVTHPITPGQIHDGKTSADIRWRYTVTNTGAITITGITVTDIVTNAGAITVSQCDSDSSNCLPQPVGGITLAPSTAAYFWSP
jgi:hypothetical protein